MQEILSHSRHPSKEVRMGTKMEFKVVGFLLLLHLYAEIQAAHIHDTSTLDSCPIKVEPIGCYKDEYGDRALATEVLNARDTSRHIYAGYQIEWEMPKWRNYLNKFICDCAQLAFKKGYRVMGIQFYGECWAAMNGHLTYKKHGETKTCVHGENKYWGRCADGDVTCTGEALTNYVYRIAPTVCDTYYEPIGCFNDKGTKPRPLPDYVMNERDYTIGNWNGKLIDWINWDTYTPEMICRCAKKAKDLNRKTFSLQFYGECWTGEESMIDYARDGANADKCIAQKFKKCPYNSYNCVGKDHGNQVYRIKEIPSKAKPWKNPNSGMPLILVQDEEKVETNW